MAKVTFNLKKPNGKEASLILVRFLFYNFDITLSTGEMILPTKWDPVTHNPKPSRVDEKAENLTNRLFSIRRSMLKAYADHLEKNHRIIFSELKEELRVIARPVVEEAPKERSLIAIAKEFVKICNKKSRTIIHYNTTVGVIEDYQKAKKLIIYPEDVDMEFYYSFVQWLENKDKSKNTIGSHIKQIKVFMTYANDKNYTQANGHNNKRFKVLEEESDSIYLTEEEILQIYKLQPEKKSQIDIRDAFIIACYTGLRYSDLTQLGEDKFLDNKTKIKIATIKTGEKVIIPLHWTIREILERRQGDFPRIYADQFFNRQIKLLAADAKITNLVSKAITRGGKQVSKSYEKNKLVTIHTARRSFATNAFKAGMPVYSIMKITGHRSEKSFKKYIKIDSEQSAELIEDHIFFSKPGK